MFECKRDETQRQVSDLMVLQPLPYDAEAFLRSYLQVPVLRKVVHEEVTRLDFALDMQGFQAGAQVCEQRALFEHAESGEHLLSAASLLLLDPLPAHIRQAILLHPGHRIEHLLLELPTKQEIVAYEMQHTGLLTGTHVSTNQFPCFTRAILYTLDRSLMLVYEEFPLREGP